jgi:hypothetical protein
MFESAMSQQELTISSLPIVCQPEFLKMAFLMNFFPSSFFLEKTLM